MDVEAIKERAREFGLVIFTASWGFRAFLTCVTKIATSAWVHGSDELEVGGVSDVVIGAGYDGFTSF